MRMVLMALVLLLLICGCEDNNRNSTAPAQVVPKPKANKKTVATPVEQPVEEVVEEKEAGFKYDPVVRRDPFKSLLDIQIPVLAPKEEPATPLQKYDVAQIRLLGVIVGMDGPRAMIVAPDGKSYILHKGTKVGKNNGSVIEINSNGVFIEEVYYDFAGEIRKNVKSIELPKLRGVE